MNDISELASLNFEDLAQADLFDLVTSSSASQLRDCSEHEPDPDEDMSRTSSPVAFDQEESYTHITLINGEQICLREESETDWSDSTGADTMTMDLNSVLQAGVVESVTSTVSNMEDLDDLDWDPEDTSRDVSSTSHVPRSQQTVIKPRHTHTILASQLPLPVPARLHRTGHTGHPTAVVISSSLVTQETSSNNNNNSLLKAALIGKQSSNGSTLLSGESQQAKTVLATVKVRS